MDRDGEGRLTDLQKGIPPEKGKPYTATQVLKDLEEMRKRVTVEHGETIPYVEPPESMRGLTVEKFYARPVMDFWRDKVFGRQPVIEIHNFPESRILDRTVHWPWFRAMVVGRIMNDVTVPKRFALTYYSFDQDAFYFHLIPFNTIIAICRRVYQVFVWEIPAQFVEWERAWRRTHPKPNKRGRDERGRFKKNDR